MDSRVAQELFAKHAPSMAYVAVRTPEGDDQIGSAFHVGEGVFVTARHVVEKNEIVEIRPTRELRRPIKEVIPEYTDDVIQKIIEVTGQEPSWPVFQPALKISRGPFYLTDPNIDVAVFAVEGLHIATPYVALGSHLDDWIHRTEFVMSDAIILGYPPIPMTKVPYLVAARAEVNAVVDTVNSPKTHFIVSTMARGGFSGGLALSEYGFVLGVITESLGMNQAPAELGFMAVLSVEPIYECLAASKLLPKCQKEGWDDFWNMENWDFVTEIDARASELRASISRCDDGCQLYVGLYCRDPKAMEQGLAAVARVAPADRINVTQSSEMHARVSLLSSDKDAAQLAEHAVRAACDAMIQFGYKEGPRSRG